MIDDDEPFPEAGQDGRGKANNAEKLRQVEKMMLALDLDEVNEKEGLGTQEWEVNMDWL